MNRFDDVTAHRQALAELGVDCQLEISVRSRTVGISVAPGGLITIRMPRCTEPRDLVEIVRRRMEWLARARVQQMASAPAHPVKRMVEGESYSLLGRNHRLRFVDLDDHSVRVRGNWLEVAREAPTTMAAEIIDWYKRCGREWLDQQLPRWALLLGVPFPHTRIEDLGTRWGHCDQNGIVRFHWALFQVPNSLVELVLAHELVHLTEPGHGARFQRTLARLIPDHHARFEALTVVGSRSWMGRVESSMPPSGI
ncbi:M48 family metallopeptidase [Nonomuraea sp. CA-141351]|uniref:M48 family metallopeptidase n=1 Tax=Nonomuraea sp. CA-141351 TaxID=3239996 RepID=UPI003D8D881D